jgi:predicted small secreted protein
MSRLIVICATILMVGCSTVAGVGADIKGAADWTKDKISGGTKL